MTRHRSLPSSSAAFEVAGLVRDGANSAAAGEKMRTGRSALTALAKEEAVTART
jgi:hypothetical protein